MSGELVGPLRRVYYNGGVRGTYDLPKSTFDLRFTACADHHLACDCREADIAEAWAEHRDEINILYNAILDAIKGHNTYALDQFAMCKCPACGIARKANVGYFECKRQRREADAQRKRDTWLRQHKGATLAPAYPYADIEVPF